jgi:hypothetical protein
LSKAKELVNGLPGGEMVIEEQDEIIDMLEKLRDHKQYVWEKAFKYFCFINYELSGNSYPNFQPGFCPLLDVPLLEE